MVRVSQERALVVYPVVSSYSPPYLQTPHTSPPLLAAAESGHLGVVQAMLAAGAKTISSDQVSEVAMCIALVTLKLQGGCFCIVS
jgi:hypothetical protein